MQSACLARWGIGLLLVAGCGQPTVGTVSGTVTMDGKPLDQGIISFVSADVRGAPVTVNVTAGKYQLETTIGNKQVQISAPQVVGTRKEYNGPNAPLVEITAERLGPEYNSRTTLTYTVMPGTNTKDWDVQSLENTKSRSEPR